MGQTLSDESAPLDDPRAPRGGDGQKTCTRRATTGSGELKAGRRWSWRRRQAPSQGDFDFGAVIKPQPPRELESHRGAIRAGIFDAERNEVWTASKSVRVWNAATGD